MPIISEDQWQALAHAMRREVANRFPDWTDSNEHDPGITLLQLCTFLTESLLHRGSQMESYRRRVSAERLANAANALATLLMPDSTAPHGDGPLRVNYFFGQMLGVDEFIAEQDYIREKFRRLHRYLHGVGIVSGLRTSIDRSGGGAHLGIEPGLALDARGEVLKVRQPVSVPLPDQGDSLFVQIRYAERPCCPVPTLTEDDGSEAPQYARVEETCEVSLVPTPNPAALALARLTYVKKRWVIARGFKALRAANSFSFHS